MGRATAEPGIGKGIVTGDLGAIGRGFANLGAAAIMLRSGSASGLLHPGGRSSLTPDTGTRLNGASRWHDGHGGLATRSAPQFEWVQRAWTGSGVELGPWGQAYRIYGTAGFGLIGAGQKALGYWRADSCDAGIRNIARPRVLLAQSGGLLASARRETGGDVLSRCGPCSDRSEKERRALWNGCRSSLAGDRKGVAREFFQRQRGC